MKKIFVFFFVCISLSYITAQSVYTDPRTNIPVSFTTDENMYPESWKGGTINAEATSLNETEYDRSKNIVSKALEKYPVQVLKKHIKKIYVLDDIRFYGLRYGGTNSLDAVYILNRGEDKGYTDVFVERLFHAEFSSILLRNLSYYISKTSWVSCNAETFVYGGSGKDALRDNKDSEEFDVSMHELGLLNQYASSNFENDVNSFAKNIFTPTPDFWDVIKKYPKLQCKMDLFIRFYSQIDPTFTEEYFKNFQ